MCQAVPLGDASRGPGNAIGGVPSPDPAPAAQAAAPSDPAARGAGNTFGSTSGVPASGTNGIPLGANAGLAPGAGQHSFAEQGYSGVGTPLGVPYGAPPQAAQAATNPSPTIAVPRMMDAGPLFGSHIAATPGTTSSGPYTPSEGYTGLPRFNPAPAPIATTAPTPQDGALRSAASAAAPSATMELFAPAESRLSMPGTASAPSGYQGMTPLGPESAFSTPVSNTSGATNPIVNALLRRKVNQGGYY